MDTMLLIDPKTAKEFAPSYCRDPVIIMAINSFIEKVPKVNAQLISQEDTWIKENGNVK